MNKKVEILSGVTALHSSLTSNQPAGGGPEPGVGVSSRGGGCTGCAGVVGCGVWRAAQWYVEVARQAGRRITFYFPF